MKILNYLFMAFISIQSVSVLAQTSQAIPPGGSLKVYGSNGTCRMFTNNSSFSQHIPMNTATERARNSGNTPQGITVSTTCTSSGTNEVCGAAHGQPYTSQPHSSQLCSVGSYSTPSNSGFSGAWGWTCYGSGGGSDASCVTSLPSSPVKGACGKSHNQPYTSQPPYDQHLCDAGNYSSITEHNTKTGPIWFWTCEGTGGGSTDSCTTN